MSLADDLKDAVDNILVSQWIERKGQVVPTAENVQLGNHSVIIDGVVLYADMSESTKLVDSKKATFAAEIYKSYLHCAAKIIRSEGGSIVSYDGDRIMAVFMGEYKNSQATRTAMKINFARIEIINPKIASLYPSSGYEVKHTIGVDASSLFVSRTGIRGSNDLVWVGKAANHAAKLCSLPNDYPSRITGKVFKKLPDNLKISNGTPMWEKVNWNTYSRTIYRSTWWWRVS